MGAWEFQERGRERKRGGGERENMQSDRAAAAETQQCTQASLRLRSHKQMAFWGQSAGEAENKGALY